MSEKEKEKEEWWMLRYPCGCEYDFGSWCYYEDYLREGKEIFVVERVDDDGCMFELCPEHLEQMKQSYDEAHKK